MQAPELPGLSPKQRRVARYSRLVIVVLLICGLSVLKGWFSLFMVPLLLLLIPIILWSQVASDLRLAAGTANPSLSRWADIQLASVFVFYLAVPAVGDDDIFYFFIGQRQGEGGFLCCLSFAIQTASAIAFVVAVVKFVRARRGLEIKST